MRGLIGPRSRPFAWLVLAAVLCSAAIVLVHSHAGANYRPDCPACHQERTIGASSAPVAVVSVSPSPVLIGVVHDAESPLGLSNAAHRPSSPRSPPAA